MALQQQQQQEHLEILMVDDRPENLVALEAVLSSLGYTLVAKSSGEDALRYVLQSDIKRLALILMDVQMPGMDGYETATLMRERKDLRNVPIIFITATYKSKSNVKQGYLSGSIDYIFKPYDPDVLRWKVENFVNLHRYKRELERKNLILQQQNQELERVNGKLLQAEQELLRQQRELERTVNERTKELREANAEIQESNKRFRTVFYTNPNLIAIRSRDDGVYLEVNDAWERTTGYKLEEIRTLGDQALALEYVHTKAQEATAGKSAKIRFRTRGGELRHGIVSIEDLKIGDTACELIVITDITEQEEMQRQLNRMDRLNLIGEMAAGIAHEIRNPMTTIHGFLQMWKRSRQPLSEEHIDLMLSELLRANSIISEYLSLAGNKESNFDYHNIASIVDSLHPLLQAVAVMSEKEVKVVHAGEVPTLFADEKEMRQVLLNLAKNGIEAMNAGGTLVIECYSEGNEAVIDIRDEGPGIPEALLSKLGTPFFTTKEHGTGLGLALCYSIIERHNGKINVASSPIGTTFSVRIPFANASAVPMDV
ncbi:ATP-binding protein [Paenibacillus sp. TRM 82003]|nr:ATP-binding protein [Paenibacillus sp. TRM 82003]